MHVATRPIRPELISVSVARSEQEYFYSLLERMLVHCRVTPSIEFAGTHLYNWVERGTVRVKCLAQEHNIFYSVNYHLVFTQSKWPIRPDLIPVSVARSEQEYSTPPWVGC